jgi:competence protein ComEC
MRTAAVRGAAWLPALRRLVRHPLAPACVLAALAGAVLLQCLTHLPPAAALLAAALIALPAWRWPLLRLPLMLLLGAASFGLRAEWGLQQRLPYALEGVDLDIRGRLADLPTTGVESTRFDLLLEEARQDGTLLPLRGRIRLSWFGQVPPLPACSRWQLRVRLKRPRGAANPGGWDVERHALQLGLVATGYVRDDGDNRALGAAAFCVDRWREHIAAHLAAQLGDTPVAHLLRALAVGDQRGLSEADWQVLRATGVGHLIAISGFHVSLLALAGAAVTRRLWRCFPRLALRWPGLLIETPSALACATAYAALAGFGLATLRTLLMLAVVALARLLRRHLPVRQALALALAAILLGDPLAILSAGFWLSFAGVALLLFCLDGRPLRAWWHELVQAQGAMSLGLLPLTVALFGQSSLVGPLANLIAVPWISLVVVPLILAGALLALALPMIGNIFIHLAAIAMDAQWRLLQWMAQWPVAQWHFAESGLAALLLGLAGALWLLAPRGVPLRGLALLLLLPLLWPPSTRPARGEFEASVIDVGQGLAVLLRTREHALLYDTGARFASGFDLGEAVVVPAAQALGVTRLDLLVVSHADIDHAGGAGAVTRSLQPREILAGEPVALPGATACTAGQAWYWDGVEIRVLHPGAQAAVESNDRSCVLLVQSGQGRLLLTGDISANVEATVAEAAGTAPLALLVPHHGSKTSSSAALLDALQIQLALVSAGHRNRFGHPHAAVTARYRERGIALLNTADSGCIRVLFRPDAAPRVIERCRPARAKYWRDP